MRKKRLFLPALLASLLLCLTPAAQAAPWLLGDPLQTGAENWVAIDCPDLSRINESRTLGLIRQLTGSSNSSSLNFLGLDTLNESFKDLSALVTLASDKDMTPQKLLFAAELKADISELSQDMTGSQPFEVNVPDGVALKPLEVRDNGDGTKIYTAQLSRDGRFYLLVTSSPEILPAMAVREPEERKPRRFDSDLWIQCHFSIKALDLEGQVSSPLELEIGLKETPRSLKIQSWLNSLQMLEGVLGDHLDPASGPQASAFAAPRLLGSGPLLSLLALDNSWIPADLKLEDLGLPADDQKEAEENLTTLQLLTGITWQDILSTLRGLTSISLQGSINVPMAGTFPSFMIQLGGASENLSRVAAGWAMTMAKQQGITATPLSPDQYGGWEGIAFSHPMAPGLELLLGYGPGKGMAATVVPAGTNPFMEGRLEVSPELKDFICQGRPLSYCWDIAATLEQMRQGIQGLSALLLGSDDSPEIEKFCAFLENWKALTFSCGLETMDAELFFAPVPAESQSPSGAVLVPAGTVTGLSQDKVNPAPEVVPETYTQRLARLIEPLYEGVAYDSDGELMAQIEDVKFFLDEDSEAQSLTFYCGLTVPEFSEKERLDIAMQWTREYPETELEIDIDGEDTTFWMSQTLSVAVDPGDEALTVFARSYGDHVRALMKALNW